MKIQVVSDLHLEFGPIVLKNTTGADVLCLCGDILVASELESTPIDELTEINKHMYRPYHHQRYIDFFKQVAEEFPTVLYIAGNHEHYHGALGKTYKLIRRFLEELNLPNVHYLADSIHTIDNVVFVGGTMWTDCNKGDPMTMGALKSLMNDYRIIRNDYASYRRLTPEDTTLIHKKFVDYVKLICSDNRDKRVVLMTHHAPSFKSVASVYADQFYMNGGYASDLSDLILDNGNIFCWFHGHMHNSFDYEIDQTRVICNPRGYFDTHDQNKNFDPCKTIEI